MENPYQVPNAELQTTGSNEGFRYAGFWLRTGASVVDSILQMLIALPLMFLIGGGMSALDGTSTSLNSVAGIFIIFLQYILPIILVLGFWFIKSATPGKMLFQAKIVDAATGGKPSKGQFVLRYIGYIPSTLVLGLGFFWVIWDKRKQSWHDKIASTVVIRPGDDPAQTARFES